MDRMVRGVGESTNLSPVMHVFVVWVGQWGCMCGCLGMCVCVCDEMSVCFGLCKHYGLLRDGTP